MIAYQDKDGKPAMRQATPEEIAAMQPTVYQLACEEWMHMDYAIRIVAPIELALSYPEIYVWFQVNDFPIEKREGQVLLYCNEVLPQHQPLIDAIESIYVEKRPVE